MTVVDRGVGHEERRARCRVRSGRSRTCTARRIAAWRRRRKVRRGGRGPGREQAAVAQEFVDFGQAGAELFGFELQQAFASLRGIALGFKVGGVLRELLVLGFALQFFGGGGFDLRGQRVDALAHFGE